MSRVTKLDPIPPPVLRTAHDVRHLVACAGCRAPMDERIGFHFDTHSIWHGCCYVAAFGLPALLACSADKTAHLTLGDIGVDTMRALLERTPAAIGARGGKATGKRKARDPAHYKRLADMKRARAGK